MDFIECQHLLTIQMKWIIFIKIFKNTYQIKRKILIVFDDMIADMISNIKLNPVVTELFIREGELNISYVFITQLQLQIGICKN